MRATCGTVLWRLLPLGVRATEQAKVFLESTLSFYQLKVTTNHVRLGTGEAFVVGKGVMLLLSREKGERK